MKLHDLRDDYENEPFALSDMDLHPIKLFEQWFEYAQTVQKEPNAACLSTYNKENGRLSSRIVLLKECTMEGLVFFTNYESAKGQQMKDHPQVAMNFYWPSIFRQVRVEGIVHKIEEKRSSDYFLSRPKASQVSALLSKQSAPLVGSRENFLSEYEEHLEDVQQGKKEITYPKFWGGYEIKVDVMEFWLGMKGRLHDRLQFKKNIKLGHWEKGIRLYP